MDDQELLTYAVKAIELNISFVSDPGVFFIYDDSRDTAIFNPLVNDADAFQLAFKLKMELITNQKNKLNEAQRQCRARLRVGDGIRNFYEILDENMQDASPLRRAIVRAAAEIGKGMK